MTTLERRVLLLVGAVLLALAVYAYGELQTGFGATWVSG